MYRAKYSKERNEYGEKNHVEQKKQVNLSELTLMDCCQIRYSSFTLYCFIRYSCWVVFFFIKRSLPMTVDVTTCYLVSLKIPWWHLVPTYLYLFVFDLLIWRCVLITLSVITGKSGYSVNSTVRQQPGVSPAVANIAIDSSTRRALEKQYRCPLTNKR